MSSSGTLLEVSSPLATDASGRGLLVARGAAYMELAKVRILVMVLVAVAVAGIVGSWGQPTPGPLLHALVGTLLVAGSASVLNQWWEKETDRLMERTSVRPLPEGRLTSRETLCVGLVALLLGTAYLIRYAGWQPAFWAAATWFLYVLVYTPLKRRTWLNTAVGAVPGALPIFIGWTAGGGSLDSRAWCLFLLVFIWQFPHFMAIAWLYRHQYRQAGMQMLTVVDPSGRRPGVQAVLGALALVLMGPAVALLMQSTSAVYLLASLVLGLAQLRCAIRFLQHTDTQSARALLRMSLIYLPAQLGLISLLSLSLL